MELSPVFDLVPPSATGFGPPIPARFFSSMTFGVPPAGSYTIAIQVALTDGVPTQGDWIDMTNSAGGPNRVFTLSDRCKWVRANVTAYVSGTCALKMVGVYL